MSWHPLEQACRVGDDQLYMIDEWMGPWAIIRRLQVDGETIYRAVTFREDRSKRELIGYSRNLRALVLQAYRRRLMDSGTPLPDTPRW